MANRITRRGFLEYSCFSLTATRSQNQPKTHRNNQKSTNAEILSEPQNDVGWPSFQFDAQNTGHAPDERVPGSVDLRWTFETGADVEITPALSDEKMFIGDHSGTLIAVDRGTGTKIWDASISDTRSSINNAPTIFNGSVIIGDDIGILSSFDEETGEKNWTYDTGGTILTSSPTAVDGSVYIGGESNAVHSINSNTGKREWIKRVDNPVWTTPAVLEDTVYFGSNSSKIYAVDANSGSTQWVKNMESWVAGAPSILNDKLIACDADGYVVAFDAQNGDQIWSTKLNGEITSSPAVTSDGIYIGAQEDGFYSIDFDSGEIDWSFNDGGRERYGPPTVAGDKILLGIDHVGDGNESLFALNTDGSLSWSFEVDGRTFGGVAIDENSIFFGSSGGDVYALGSRATDQTSTNKEPNETSSTPTEQTTQGATTGSRVRPNGGEGDETPIATLVAYVVSIAMSTIALVFAFWIAFKDYAKDEASTRS